VIVGFLLTGPYAILYPVYIIKQLQVVTGGSGGFLQPHWAQLSDILGLTNLYVVTGFGGPFAYGDIPRLRIESLSVFCASLAAFFFMLRLRAGTSAWQRGPWLAAGFVALMTYGISSKSGNNYLFYKTYVMLNFLFYSWFICGFHSAVTIPGVSPAIRRNGVALINLLILMVSLSYLITYRSEARWTGAATTALIDWDRKNDANRYVFLTTETDFTTFMEAGAIPLNWLNHMSKPPRPRRRINFEPHLGKRILILSLSRNGKRPWLSTAKAGQTMLLSTPHVTLLDSGVTLSRDLADQLEAEIAETLRAGQTTTKQVWSRMFVTLGVGFVE
jgi:hypothetical protein